MNCEGSGGGSPSSRPPPVSRPVPVQQASSSSVSSSSTRFFFTGSLPGSSVKKIRKRVALKCREREAAISRKNGGVRKLPYKFGARSVSREVHHVEDEAATEKLIDEVPEERAKTPVVTLITKRTLPADQEDDADSESSESSRSNLKASKVQQARSSTHSSPAQKVSSPEDGHQKKKLTESFDKKSDDASRDEELEISMEVDDQLEIEPLNNGEIDNCSYPETRFSALIQEGVQEKTHAPEPESRLENREKTPQASTNTDKDFENSEVTRTVSVYVHYPRPNQTLMKTENITITRKVTYIPMVPGASADDLVKDLCPPRQSPLEIQKKTTMATSQPLTLSQVMQFYETGRNFEEPTSTESVLYTVEILETTIGEPVEIDSEPSAKETNLEVIDELMAKKSKSDLAPSDTPDPPEGKENNVNMKDTQSCNDNEVSGVDLTVRVSKEDSQIKGDTPNETHDDFSSVSSSSPDPVAKQSELESPERVSAKSPEEKAPAIHASKQPGKSSVQTSVVSGDREISKNRNVRKLAKKFEAPSGSQELSNNDNETTSKKKRNRIDIPHYITSIQGDPTQYRCNVCQRKFKTKAHIKYHESCHKGLKRFKCTQCQKGFNTKSHYEYHLRTHTGERPYKCEICGKGFNQQGKVTRHVKSHTRGNKLKSHKLIHTGNRPHVRPHCAKNFVHKYELQSHLKAHTGEKPYSCDRCQQCFAYKKDLQRHLVIHTREKPFKCPICSKGFGRKDNLRRHIRDSQCAKRKEVADQLADQANEYLARQS